jgi:hypothetical protein
MEHSRVEKIGIVDRLLAPAVLVLFCIVALWLPHLCESFWLDELQTAWVVNGTFGQTIARAIETQGFTPFYYLLIWSFRPLIGMSEFGLRLPSIVLTLGSAYLLFRIARSFLVHAAAMSAVLLFVCLDGVIDTAINARPYSSALFFALASFYSFQLWLERGLIRHRLLYIVSTVFTIYAHFFFAGIVLVELAYWYLLRRNSVRISRLLGILIYVPIALIPTGPQIQSMLQKKEVMAIARMPGFGDLLTSWVPWTALIAVVVAYFLASACIPRAADPKESPEVSRLDKGTLGFLFLWSFSPALILFAASHFLGTSVFVSRYFEWASPGFAILFGALISRLENVRLRFLLPVFFALFSVSAELTKERFYEDWRGAVTRLNAERGSSRAPVLLYSGVIESTRMKWMVDPVKLGQFTSPILYYSVQDPVYPLPFRFDSADGETYWAKNVGEKIRAENELYLLVMDNFSWTAINGKRMTIRQDRGGVAPQALRTDASVSAPS